jgi:putative ABC transport system substrate-binding protein
LGKKRVDRVQRRSVIVGLAVSLVVPQRPSAQQVSAKIPRVGFLTIGDNERTRILDAFRGGLRDLGYVEGRNIILEFRFAHGDLSRGPQLAAELVTLPTDVIVTEGFPPDVVDPSGHVPIVVPALMDPVQCGFAFSIARPGRNITGFTLMHTELNGKRLELLRTASPDITAFTALINPAAPSSILAFEKPKRPPGRWVWGV